MLAAGRARAVPLILVVDDEHDIRELIAEALALEGYDVSTASDGQIALEQAQANLPDLILLDLMMPVMSGWEFMEAQRRDPELASIPVLVVTASFDSEVGGAAALMRKPFDLETLLPIVARLCGVGREKVSRVDERLLHRSSLAPRAAPVIAPRSLSGRVTMPR